MMVLVEPSGPPFVITKMDSNMLNASITSRMATTNVVLESIGTVMRINFCHPVAPSTSAASYNVSGMVCSPARNISI